MGNLIGVELGGRGGRFVGIEKLPKIVVPKRYVPIKPGDIILFLAGPVLGGGDWQARFIKAFICPEAYAQDTYFHWTISLRENLFPRIKFIVPCRWAQEHELNYMFTSPYELVDPCDSLENEAVLCSQTMWENHYLPRPESKYVGHKIIFGLFPEDRDIPRIDGNPYAGDTLGEIGRWTTTSKERGHDNIFIGYSTSPGFGEKTFPRLDTITKNLKIHWLEEMYCRNFVHVYNPENLAVSVAQQLVHNHKKFLGLS